MPETQPDKANTITSQQSQAQPYNRPLVFVPGFMASSLERPGRGLLLPPLGVWPLNLLTLTTQLFILRNPTPLRAVGLVGRYYDGLLDFLIRPGAAGGLGLTPSQNCWIFPYDWRQSCQQSGQELALFIERKLAEANERRAKYGLPAWQSVDVINHSMGGFVTRSAQRQWGAPVRRVVYVASGHYGVTKAYFVLHPDTATRVLDDFIKDFLPGWYWDLLKTLPNVWFLQGWLAKLLRTLPAMYELLPDQFYLEETPGLLLDASQTPPQPVLGIENTYFQHSWRLPTVLQPRVRQAMQFKESLGRDLPGPENLVIYSSSLPTYVRASYQHRLEAPELLPVGDRTVTASSANRAAPATRLELEATHIELANHPTAHEAILKFLSS